MNTQTSQIQSTASTLFDLSNHTDIPHCHQIAELMVKKTGVVWAKLSGNNFHAFPVSRFSTSQSFLDLMAEKLGSKLQIVELGAGFTPHYLNLKNKIGKYIEVDHEANSALKKEIINELEPNTPNLVFVGGDISEQETWNRIKENIDATNPVIIFSEGVVAQYFSKEQKEALTDNMKELLVAEGSAFVIDDTLRNHPEVHNNPIIKEGMEWIAKKSGSKVYNVESQSFEDEVQRWKKLLPDTQISLINYIRSKPEMDFVIDSFKLIVCLKTKQSELLEEIRDLSKNNSTNRIWK